MARGSAEPTKRDRGEIETLPSGSLRVKVYAGMDKVTSRRLYLTETVKPGPRQARIAEECRTKLLNQVDEQRNPKTRATVDQLFTRYFEVADLATSTRTEYMSKYRIHIQPYLGRLPLTAVQDAETLDSLYAEMRRCSKHCRKQKGLVDHRTDKAGHACDEHRSAPCSPPNPDGCRACRRACKPHKCVPLGASSIREVHWLISGAFDRGLKWKWISVNPADQADKPALPKPDPRSPTATEAAQLINAAYEIDVDWGEFIFAKATTGNRRSEHCALQWKHFEDPAAAEHPEMDEEPAILVVRQSLYKTEARTLGIKDTKTHQHRRQILGEDTRLLLRERYARKKAEAALLGIELSTDAFIFSPVPDGRAPFKPDTATQKFGRMAARLGIDAELKNWRHYNATELLDAGVDLNVIAGRLGHGGGGSTTLKFYSAFHAERSQRAAEALIIRMPPRPAAIQTEKRSNADEVVRLTSADETNPEPYRRIAADLRGAIMSGFAAPGSPLPPMKTLASRYGVSPSTAHRAIALLVEAGLVKASRGVRATVAAGLVSEPGPNAAAAAVQTVSSRPHPRHLPAAKHQPDGPARTG
jgi:integrase/DNA-binding transcriptional regulator YhcF (GntR family)